MSKPTKKELKAREDKDALVSEMRKRYDQHISAERHNIDAALLDLRVLVGEDHWDTEVAKERKEDGRPCLVVNQLPVFTRQVIGDQRQSRPATQVIPSDDAANLDVAGIIEGKIRDIKYRSKADVAHDNAYGQTVRCGFGYWRIKTDYESDKNNDQTVVIESVSNQFSVKFDPASVKWDKTDANWLIIDSNISKEVFKDKYPKAAEPSEEQVSDIGPEWYLEDEIKITEYFKKRFVPKTLYQMELANPVDPDIPLVDFVDNTKEKEEFEAKGYIVTNQRQIDSYEIIRYLMCGHDILEDEILWPSKYWPVIEVLGETINVNGKPYKRSLIRDAHDSQRSFNYAISSEVETFSLAPKTPYVGTVKQFMGFESKWKQAHKKTFAYLPYNPDPAAQGAPQRVDPPQLSSAMVAFRTESKQNLRDVIGIFDAGLGNQSNEVSGIAIEGRKRESDTGTYVWIDNLQYALELEDRIILDLLPKIYDNNRKTMTRSVDGTSSSVEINKPSVKDGQRIMENDFTKGIYDVVVTMGPSFSTQRHEARANMMDLIGKVPALAPFIVDKLVRSMDFQDAQDIAKRLITGGVVPKQVLSEEELKSLPPEMEQPAQPDPMMLAQIELASTQAKLNLAKADKALADVMKIKEDIQAQQKEMTMKVMEAIEAKLGGGMRQQQGQDRPQGQPRGQMP